MLRFYGLRVLKDYIGHIILIGLPVTLISLMVIINEQANPERDVAVMALYIGLIYIIMFQGFGAAYTFEGIEHDFFSPFKDRLRAAPTNPMVFILANIAFGVLTSFLQSLVLVGFISVVFNVTINNLLGVLGVLFIGVVLAQLLAALLILVLKKASKAQAMITIYIIAGMVSAGFFFPLPQSEITEFLSKYSSPLAWTHYAAYGLINEVYSEALVGIGLLGGLVVVLTLVVYFLSRRVVL